VSGAGSGEERLLTFEVDGALYTLPIASVLEVTERGAIVAVPGLPRPCGGVMNWHGDPLPVVVPRLLFDDAAELDAEAACEHVLVVADRSETGARLGLPVDRVLGLVNGPAVASHGGELVAERCPLDGRIANVLDPRRLVARAAEVIQYRIDPIDGNPANQGGVG
jgi:chemotaxis signal transduction protein